MKEFDQLMLDLKRRIFKPVYFLQGDEPYYIDQLSDYIEENALDEADRGFNQTIVYGKDADMTSIIGLAKQFPMSGSHNVVIVKEAQNLKELNKSAGDDGEEKKETAGQQHLLNYLSNPQPSTILVFCYKYKTIDKRTAVAKALQKTAVIFESKKLYDNKIPDWISQYVKDHGYAINPKASFLLSEYLGNDLSKIAGEIGKLFIGLQNGTEITPAMVQDNIGISKDFNVFELQEALATRDVMKANRIVNYFAANEKDNPVPMVLALLYSYFSKILRYHCLDDKSKFAAAQALGVNPYFVDGYARAASMYSTPKLKEVFSLLKECDLKSKGVDNASIPGGELLKEMVYRILH